MDEKRRMENISGDKKINFFPQKMIKFLISWELTVNYFWFAFALAFAGWA